MSEELENIANQQTAIDGQTQRRTGRRTDGQVYNVIKSNFPDIIMV